MMTKADEEGLLGLLRSLEVEDAKHQGQVGPSVHAYGSQRPMGRIRSYTSAGLSPFAGRGLQSEFHLLGHVHLAPDGRVTAVEGFNGAEGERWAKQAHEKLQKADKLAPDATLRPATPLRACAHTGIR